MTRYPEAAFAGVGALDPVTYAKMKSGATRAVIGGAIGGALLGLGAGAIVVDALSEGRSTPKESMVWGTLLGASFGAMIVGLGAYSVIAEVKST